MMAIAEIWSSRWATGFGYAWVSRHPVEVVGEEPVSLSGREHVEAAPESRPYGAECGGSVWKGDFAAFVRRRVVFDDEVGFFGSDRPAESFGESAPVVLLSADSCRFAAFVITDAQQEDGE